MVNTYLLCQVIILILFVYQADIKYPYFQSSWQLFLILNLVIITEKQS